MTYGPIDFIALEFKGNQFKGEIMPALLELVNNKTIGIIDLVVVKKDQDGKVMAQEVQELDSTSLTMVNPLKADITGMIKVEDIEMIGEKLENNCTAMVMLFENLWAVRLKEALLNANGRVVMQERIPHEVVLEVLEDFALAEKAGE